MILEVALVIAIVTTIVIIACFKATGVSIDVNSINIKKADKEE